MHIIDGSKPSDEEIKHWAINQRARTAKDMGLEKTIALKEAVENGVSRILFTERSHRYIPIEWRRSWDWKEHTLKHIKSEHQRGTLCSDASKRAMVGCAVVSHKGLEFATTVGGRQTSQRGEGFGLVISAWISRGDEITGDPATIINGVRKIREKKLVAGAEMKIKNRSLVRTIAFITEKKNISIRWIKGHTKVVSTKDEIMNNNADKQARRVAKHKRTPQVSEFWEHTDEYFALWKGELYEGNIRAQVLKKCKKLTYRNFIRTSRGNRFDKSKYWVEEVNKIDLLKYSSFKFKMLSKTLPTMTNMRNNFPGVYDNAFCYSCFGVEENDLHLFSRCPSTIGARNGTWKAIVAILSAATDVSADQVAEEVPRWIPGKFTEGISEWYDGRIPNSVKFWLRSKKASYNKAIIWNYIHATIWENVHDIWIYRCDKIRKNGLTLAVKKKETALNTPFDWESYQEEIDITPLSATTTETEKQSKKRKR